MSALLLYAANTPNGQKIPIFLEEAELEYDLHYVDFSKKEQFDPAYLKLNPNNKIPTLTDADEAMTIFESGAILLYLAEKTGKFLPEDPRARSVTIQWLFWQMGGVGPMFGQLNHFKKFAPKKIEYALERYETEVHRLLGVLEKRLSSYKFIAGTYSIADMATWPWVNSAINFLEMDMTNYPKIVAWHKNIAARPAVKKGLERLAAAANA